MKSYTSQQIIGQLEKRKGGYFFLRIEAEVVNQFPNKRHTRFLCKLEDRLTFQCGLNHLGDGHFFIILSSQNLASIQKKIGDTVHFELIEDPNPLGMAMPEVLENVIEQDDHLKTIFTRLSPGKKRNIIYQVAKLKNLDKQIQKSIQLIQESTHPRPKKSL